MAWMLRPKLPASSTFAGQIVYNSTDVEVSDDLKKFIESVEFEISPQFEIKNTGFEKKKYRKTDASTINISILLVGSLPFYMHEILLRLATAVNGSGMILEFSDDFVSGSDSTTVTYNCRWINAGDFVANNELLNGGSIDLVTYTIPESEGSRGGTGVPSGGEWDVVIDTPASGTEWNLIIDDASADYVYYEAIS